ncbi:transcription factor [Sorochytrium milnesiophthora]
MSKACQACQRRKRRCSGGKPCQRCAHLGEECTYVWAHKRGPKAKRRQTAGGSDCSSESEEDSSTISSDAQPLSQTTVSSADSVTSTADRESSSDAWLASLQSDFGMIGSSSGTGGAHSIGSSDSNSLPPLLLNEISINSAQQAAGFQYTSVGIVSNGVDERIRAAMLGIDLDAVLAIFYNWFSRFVPVFTEQELRRHISLNEAPDHVLYALAAIATTYSVLPRSRLYHYDTLPPQAEFFANKAQETLLPRLERLVAPTIFEGYSVMLLALQMSYQAMALQIVDSLTSSNNTTLQPLTPTARHISILYWSLWIMDHTAVLLSSDRCLTVSFGSSAKTPAFPDLPTSPESPFNATVVFASFVRINTIATRVVLWFRDALEDKQARHTRMRSIGLLPLASSETAQTLNDSLYGFISPSSFPPSYVVTDPDLPLAPILARMSTEEVHFWLTTNMLYRISTLYFDMDTRRKWHTVELIAKIAAQVSLPISSFATRLAAETADELIHGGHISPSTSAGITAPATTPMATMKTSAALACMPGYPTLEQVVAWYDDIFTTKATCYWWVREDFLKLKATVDTWRGVMLQQTAFAAFEMFSAL